MIDVRLLAEAERNLTICNACRYCEGVCPVFVSLERRQVFAPGDIVYLANLCHDCRACYEVCPFTPPHELAVNVPLVLAEVREATYRSYAVPSRLAGLFRRGSVAIPILAAMSIIGLLVITLLTRPGNLFSSFTEPGSFYEVIPWLAMVIPALVVTAYGVAVISVAAFRFWRDTDGSTLERLNVRAFAQASVDVLGLRQMRGGGPGCAYPTERPSHRRVVLHQLVFYGFGLTFLSTILAALYQDVLGILPPYPVIGPVVLTGAIGGLMQIVGCSGLLALKARASAAPSSPTMFRMDTAFLITLLLVNLTGFPLLVLRDSQAMGSLLIIHLATCFALFLTIPYSKFVHFIYRAAALIRNRQEEIRESNTIGPGLPGSGLAGQGGSGLDAHPN